MTAPPSRRLAAALAERLDAVVPRPLRVLAEDGSVALYDGAGWWGGSHLDGILEEDIGGEDDRQFAERAGTAVRAVLSSVQDSVARALRAEWPVLPAGGMALPDARTDGSRVYLWYGPDEQTPALSFAPIVLADLLEAG